jgi:hypothetical protein
MKIQEAGWASAHHRSRVVASCFDCGDALGEQLIPFALPLLQLLDAPGDLGLGPATSKPDLKGSSAARISSSAALR